MDYKRAKKSEALLLKEISKTHIFIVRSKEKLIQKDQEILYVYKDALDRYK